jgi:hypothetical protein
MVELVDRLRMKKSTDFPSRDGAEENSPEKAVDSIRRSVGKALALETGR